MRVQEFLRFLLDSIHEEMRVPLPAGTSRPPARPWLTSNPEDDAAPPDLQAAAAAAPAPVADPAAAVAAVGRAKKAFGSIVDDVFEGRLLSSVTCRNCNKARSPPPPPPRPVC
jgi:hypothetical protein